MRVIFVSPHSDPQARLGEPDAGGQCIYEHELGKALSQEGIEVLTFCRQRNHYPPVSRVKPGYTIYRLTAGGETFLPKEQMWTILPEFVTKMAAVLNKKKQVPHTVLHSHYWDGAAASLYLKANFLNLPLIWTPHSLGFTKREKYHGLANESFYHFIPRLLWENYGALAANHTVVLSKNEKTRLTRYYGADPKRISIIPPGVSMNGNLNSPKYLRKWGLSPGTRILLTIGRLSRNKGYHHAIHIAGRLRDLYPGKFALVIVGGGSKISSSEEVKYLKSLKNLVAKLKLERQVIFQPSVPHHDVSSIYALADLYLMTSEDEPFGMTVVEAMTMGKAVLAHDQGGTRDILVNNKTGFSINIHRYGKAAELIAKLFKSKVILARVGDRAQAAAHQKYSWASRLPAFIRIYASLQGLEPTRLNKLIASDPFLGFLLKI